MPETNTQNNTPNTPADVTSAAADTNTADTQQNASTEPSNTQEPKPADSQPAAPELTIESYKDMGMDAFEEQYRFNDESLKSFKEVGLSNKISPEGMKAVAEWTMNQIKAQNEAFEKVKEEWRAENAKKYGDNLKNVKTNVGRVLADFDKSGEFAKLLQAAGAEDNPAALEFLAAVGDAVLEKGSVNPNASAEVHEMTLEDIYKPKQ